MIYSFCHVLSIKFLEKGREMNMRSYLNVGESPSVLDNDEKFLGEFN